MCSIGVVQLAYYTRYVKNKVSLYMRANDDTQDIRYAVPTDAKDFSFIA